MALPAAAVVVLAVVVLAVVVQRGGDRGPEAVASRTGAYQAVCAAAATAAQDDAVAARRTFSNQAHEPLHRLASDAAAAGDRAGAARLLEAKEAVEAALDGDAPQLAGALDRLAAASAAVVENLEGRSPGPCR